MHNYPLQRQDPQSKRSVREHRFQNNPYIYIKFNYQLHLYVKYRSAGRTTAKGLILNNLSPKIKLIYQFYIKYYEYYQPYIPEYGHGIQVIRLATPSIT